MQNDAHRIESAAVMVRIIWSEHAPPGIIQRVDQSGNGHPLQALQIVTSPAPDLPPERARSVRHSSRSVSIRNCGPSARSAMRRMTLDHVRNVIGLARLRCDSDKNSAPRAILRVRRCTRYACNNTAVAAE